MNEFIRLRLLIKCLKANSILRKSVKKRFYFYIQCIKTYFFIIFSTDGSESPTLAESDADGHEKPRVKYGELVILG